MKQISLIPALILTALLAGLAPGQSQQSDITIKLTAEAKQTIALPDFRGAGAAAQFVLGTGR